MAHIAIIDDDKMFCDLVSRKMRTLGHSTFATHSLKDGFEFVSNNDVDVVFLDVQMPDGNGLEYLPQIKSVDSDPEVIIITGEGDADGAEVAIRTGAWDYIQKGSSLKDVLLPLERALQFRTEKLNREPARALNLAGLVGSSSVMKSCFDQIAHAANSEANVLITGESGTGKELVAKAIHQNCKRKASDFIVVDCATLTASLVESTLLGHVKGAFTGAVSSRSGLVTLANNGTLFLDEVGELPLAVQKSFLRVLQERRYRPVGGSSEITSDFRLIAATNKDLDQQIREDSFREDLLFRLNSISINVPPLRARKEDIRDIALFHLNRLSERYGYGIKGFSPEFIETLEYYDWPGNVRELVNALENSLASARRDHTLFPNHLPLNIRVDYARSSVNGTKRIPAIEESIARETTPLVDYKSFRDQAVTDAERIYLSDLIETTKGDIKKAMELSGLSRSRLYSLLKKNGISLNK